MAQTFAAERTDMLNRLTPTIIESAERGLLPDLLVRKGIRQLLRQRLVSLGDEKARIAQKVAFIEAMRTGPIADATDAANAQHYMVPPELFGLMLGARRKYSSGLWDGATCLDEAELRALEETALHADLSDGQQVLELGCGWGSFSLWAAERYPASTVTGVSYSSAQREYILGEARARGLTNLEILTADMNEFLAPGQYDRIVSIEMFEHMWSWPALLQRIAGWMKPDGALLIHHFSHRSTPYRFVSQSAGDWMARHFFTGGIMPSHDLLTHFQEHLSVDQQWLWSGEHYARTCEAWLENLDRHAERAQQILADANGVAAARARRRWRIFVLACLELFAYRGGEEWFVTHTRMHRTPA